MPVLKHVKPADKGGYIVDPQTGEPLPPKGAIIDWSANQTYWDRLKLRGGEIVVSDPAEETKPAAAKPEPAKPEPEKPAPAKGDAPVKPEPEKPATTTKPQPLGSGRSVTD